MTYIRNIGYTDENTYYQHNTLGTSAPNHFDSVLEAETVVYAIPESTKTQTPTKTEKANMTAPSELKNIFLHAAQKYGIDVNLLKAVAKTESNFNPNSTSAAGAMGIMQLMPDTAKSLGVTNAYDPEENIIGGAKYLSQLLNKYNDNVPLALAAYNAGPGNVDKYNGIPPFEETKNYVKKVMEYLDINDIPITSDDEGVVTSSPDTRSESDVTYISAVPATGTQSDVTTVYAVSASDITHPAKLYL